MSADQNFVHAFRERSAANADRTAFHFFLGGNIDETADAITYAGLDRAARAVAVGIQQHAVVGDRALLLFPSGLDFVAAFLGCLYAGVTAVPIPLPGRAAQDMSRLIGAVRDAGATLVLTAAATAPLVTGAMEGHQLPTLPCLTVRDGRPADPDSWVEPRITAGTPAFLQYTSGSTNAPKGVVVSHGNLVHNESLIQRAFGLDAATRSGGWLPLFHDMGLIGQVLGVLFTGGVGYLMAPTDFLKAPQRWLEMISRFRLDISGAPNFAYDLCTRRVPEEIIETLDLSCWRLAYNGAEPVRAATMTAFADRFHAAGFEHEAFFPCYGLAESTVFVSGGRIGSGAHVMAVNADDLSHGRVTEADAAGERRSLVTAGRYPREETDVSIVDPQGHRVETPGAIGEIWIRGRSVSDGYWQGAAPGNRSADTFGATLEGVGGYLRTGDLGAVTDGELVVTGRLKDLVVVRGRNIYPHDVEAEIQGADPGTMGRLSAAFSVDADEERLVVVQEIHPRQMQSPGPDVVVRAVRARLAQNLQIRADFVVLVAPGGVLRTTSGKVRRAEMKSLYLSGDLAILHEDVNPGIGAALTNARPEGPRIDRVGSAG